MLYNPTAGNGLDRPPPRTAQSMQILLADDHWFTAESIGALMKEQVPNGRLYTANSLSEAIEIARQNIELDLIILDLHMPGMDGFNGIIRIRQVRPGVPVAIMSGDQDQSSMQSALAFGAVGYIPKTYPRDSLIAAMRLIAGGMVFAPAGALPSQLGHLPDPTGAVVPDHQQDARRIDELSTLSDRERAVYELLLRGRKNKIIAEDLKISEATVKLHVRNVLRKLGYKDRVDLLANR
ncbi:MAG: response regulator [Alphaproteobacteria bacterium]